MKLSSPGFCPSRLSGGLATILRRVAAVLLALVAICTLLIPAHAEPVTIDWVTVGDPGNANDPATGNAYGAVAEEFRIAKHLVTIQQYTDFLNAVASSDPYSLYNTSMETSLNIAGISRSGTSGGYSYGVINNGGPSGNRPITYVSWFDAARFANWMHNGQGSGSTETGAYTLNGATSGTAPAKNPGAQFYIPTENEWYKAAYYSPVLNSGSGGYYTYATQSNTAPGNIIGSGANQANYFAGAGYSVTQSGDHVTNQNYLTDVGAFTNSASFYGTFDQSGNVFEWNDLDGTADSSRGRRGGNWDSEAFALSSSGRNTGGPSGENIYIGFRLASPVAVPEPSTYAMAFAGLACGGYSMWRRRKAKAIFTVALVSIAVVSSDPVLADPVTGPLSDVVFGNLGVSGTDALGGLSTNLIESGPSGTRIAMSFVTGSAGPWQLGGLRLGIGSPTNAPVPFALITEDDAGNPLMSAIAAFYYLPGEENYTTTGFYDFTPAFDAELQPSTTYWLFVGDDSPDSSSFGWYDNAAAESPTAHNDSGWSFGATKVSLDGGSTWDGYSAGNSVAFSITVVPEPSTWTVGLAGIACAGWGMWRRRKRSPRSRALTAAVSSLALAGLFLNSAHAEPVTIDWVTVGNPGNSNDTTGYGGVNYSYQIGKYEVTIGQYTDFLNAAAKSDPYSLYNTNMASDLNIAGISRSGTSGGYTYSVINNGGLSGNRPITYVSWFDAARFANWMHNGQGSGSTETGAYRLNGATSGTAPARNPGAQFYIPTENEWYKAAYYSPVLNSGSGGYYEYATQSNDDPGNVVGSGANQANFYAGDFAVTQSASFSFSQNYLTEVGAFTNSASFYGTFDQSGNVFEWNDLTGTTAGSSRGLRGGYWFGNAFNLSSSGRSTFAPSFENGDVGFRLASPVAVPEPSTWVMGLAGIACAAWGVRRRRSLTGERPPSTSRA